MAEWSESAMADFETIMDYISRDDHETAIQVGRRIRTAILRLSEFPGIGKPGRREGTRELFLPGLPFVIIYNIRNDSVQIVRILHTKMLWPR